MIDLKGALATPGFIDAHVHFTGVGDAAKNLKLAIAKSWDEIVRMVGDAAKKAKPGNGFSGGAGIRKKYSGDEDPLHDRRRQRCSTNRVPCRRPLPAGRRSVSAV